MRHGYFRNATQGAKRTTNRMASAYGPVKNGNTKLDGRLNVEAKCGDMLPVNGVLRDGLKVELNCFTASDIPKGMELMNDVIVEGTSWPFIDPFETQNEFASYFLSHAAFAVKTSAEGANEDLLGCFYIKPNFPGRCAHICNGGFITNPKYRKRGLAVFMAQAYLELARKLGYRASYFNLVFISNVASVALWRKLGFQELAVVPKCGKLKGHEELVDAIAFYKEL